MLLLLAPLVLLACADAEFSYPVRATLDDGQILQGTVETETLLLETGMGTLAIPVQDVGEVRPVEGGDLLGSGNHVNVWLRNGSELQGRWAEPELLMGLAVGGQIVAVDLPMEQLQRFQLQGGDYLPEATVFRAKTAYGDDFLVDPETTCFNMSNELGTFTPCLDEVVSLASLNDVDGNWRVQLLTGTVLIAPMEDDQMRFGLTTGPEQIDVPFSHLVSVSRQDWSGYDSYAAPASPMGGAGTVDGPAPSAEGWFDNRRQSGFKNSLH